MDPQVLKFKTAEAKEKAIIDLGEAEDAPAGVAMDDKYFAEYDKNLAELMESKIDPDYDPEAVVPDPTVDPSLDPAAVVPPEVPVTPPDQTAIMQEQINRLTSENNSRATEWAQKQKDMEKKIEDMQATKPTDPAAPPEEKVEPGKYDAEMDEVQKEIEKLDQELNNVPADEYEEKVKILGEQNKNNSRMNTLVRKASFEALKQSTKELTAVKTENAKRVDDEKRRSDIAEQKRQRTDSRTARIKTAEEFRKATPELQGEKTYEQMENEYLPFAEEVASRYWSKRTDQLVGEEIEVAMQAYNDKAPVLEAKVVDLRAREPADMKKFLLLTEIEFAKMGMTVDKYSGKLIQQTDGQGNKVVLPDLATAYEGLKKTKGITAQQIAEMTNRTAAEVKKAMEQRTNPGEIDDPHRSPELDDGMTEEVARKVIAEHDEEKVELMARQAVASGKPLPREVVYINRALNKLKLDPITGVTE